MLKVKDTCLDEYRTEHRSVWPDMLKALHKTGWHNYSLFLREDGYLFGYLETPDFKKAVEDMQKEPANALW